MRGLQCLLIWAACLGTPAYAANQNISQGTIETVQMPAWLDRNGRAQPLVVGMEVQNGDRIRTGNEARVYFKLAEGSIVKLGENATLGFHSLSLRPERMFKGALDVIKGAFRFTTSAVQRARSQRDLTIRVGTATAGIRGTDVWGKSDAERDMILLIEGEIEIRHAGSTFNLAKPLVYFSAPKNAATLLSPVAPDDLRQWARETEVLPGDGAAQRGGAWQVLLGRASSQREALDVYDTARQAGYAAQIKVRPAIDDGRGKVGRWDYDVVLAQLPNQQEAAVMAKKIKMQLGFEAIPAKR